jgi:hypothetical protein
MSNKWAYDMSDEELIRHARISGYLKGVLLSRLEGLKPPFRPGELVWYKYGQSTLLCDREEIKEIYYIAGSWFLKFTDKGFEGSLDCANNYSVNSSDVLGDLDLLP